MKWPLRSRRRRRLATRRRPLIVRLIARLNVGGPAKHVVWLNDGLRGDFDSILVTGTVPRGEHDMGYFAAGHRVRRIVVPELSREIHLRDLVVIFKIFRILLRLRPDLVHTHTAKAGTVGRVAGLLYRLTRLLSGKKARCVFVHTYHGHVFHSYYGPLKSRLFVAIERVLARIATDRIVVISPQQFREIHEVYKVGRAEQFAIVPLGIDLDLFRHTDGGSTFRSSLAIPADKILIGTIGRLTGVKNYELFLRAADRFNRQNPHLRDQVVFVMIGEGPLREKLEKLSIQLGLSNLIFAGMQQDPAAFYPALDLVALTSRNEGTPLTLIEAMAAGVPVVATDAGGVVDLLGPRSVMSPPDKAYVACERGVLVSAQNDVAFADALAFALRSSEIRAGMATRARQFIESHYSKARLIQDIASMYNTLLPGEVSRSEPVVTGSTTAVG